MYVYVLVKTDVFLRIRILYVCVEVSVCAYVCKQEEVYVNVFGFVNLHLHVFMCLSTSNAISMSP